MFANGKKRKSLVNHNGPSSKVTKGNNTVVRSQLKAPQGKGKQQHVKQTKMPIVSQSSESDDEDDLEMDDESSEDLELDMNDIHEEDDDEDDEEEGEDEDGGDENVDAEEENDDSGEENEEGKGETDEEQNVSNDSEEESDLVDSNDDQVSNEEEKVEIDNKKQKLTKTNQQNTKGNKQRYVVFVGNIPFSATVDVIRNHFKEVGPIVNVRMPPFKNGKPRGFCFVEFENSHSYEKALSLHHSFLNNRRINVEYTNRSNGEEGRKLIKKKNLKLQAMQKQGKLEGSIKATQKRTVRRAKAKQVKNGEGDMIK